MDPTQLHLKGKSNILKNVIPSGLIIILHVSMIITARQQNSDFMPLMADRYVKGGDTIKWQGIDLRVLNTPGYTRGAVSYIAEIDGKKFAFVGDLIYGEGKIFDLYSFQDSFKEIRGYHGYAARVGKLISSLQLIAG